MTFEELVSSWPGWKIWRSRNGGLVCATRRRALTADEWRSRPCMTLIENDVETLAAELARQAEIDRER